MAKKTYFDGSMADEPGTNHRQPGRVRMGAIGHLLFVGIWSAGVVALLVLMLWYESKSVHLAWIPAGLIGVSVARLLATRGARCCCCHQPVFARTTAARSPKAVVLPPLTIHATAALLALTCKSFRCPYCNRVNRMKS